MKESSTTGSADPSAIGTPARLSDEEIFTQVATRIVRMRLTAPAIFFLESSKPLSYMGSQALVFFEPFVKSVLNVAYYDRFVVLLEDRGSVERLLLRIEELDQDEREAENTRRAETRVLQDAEKPRGGRWRWFGRRRGDQG